MVDFILIKSPDEWATAKQVFSDQLVLYLFFFFRPQYMYIFHSFLARHLKSENLNAQKWDLLRGHPLSYCTCGLAFATSRSCSVTS